MRTELDNPLSILGALPWTTVSLLIILTTSLGTGLLRHAPGDAMLQRYGLGLDTLEDGRLWTLLTASFLIDHPRAIISTLIIGGVFVGAEELRAGTFRCVVAWFAGTWSTLALGALVWLPFAWFGLARPVTAVAVAEVGASGAAWCCLGATLGPPWRWHGWRRWAGLGGAVFLLYRLVAGRGFTDIEHPVAFGFGILVFGWLVSAPARTRQVSVAARDLTRLLAALAGFVVLTVGLMQAASWVTLGLGLAGAVTIVVALFAQPAGATLLLALVTAGGGSALLLEPSSVLAGFLMVTVVLLVDAWRHQRNRLPTAAT